MALLHMLVNGRLEGQAPPVSLLVAHFDHGIRSDSHEDAKFVADLAQKYGLEFASKREELGPNASEELARERRYEFLRELANKHEAQIITAHHQDDLVESIAINLIRGTAWRGLAVLSSPGIVRPLLGMTKAEILDYARDNNLDWHEDSTNFDTKYLRNSLRQKCAELDLDTKRLLLLYRNHQVVLRQQIEAEIQKLAGVQKYSRYFVINIPESVAIEFVRSVIGRDTGVMPTIPQAAAAVQAIKTLPAGSKFDVGGGVKLQFTKTDFAIHDHQ